MRGRLRTLAMGVAALTLAVTASADAASLYDGPGPRPGPDMLYEPLASSPQLENTGVWKAQPILVSGTTAYREGELLYQDYLYDDHGARFVRDPADPSTSANTFSQPSRRTISHSPVPMASRWMRTVPTSIDHDDWPSVR